MYALHAEQRRKQRVESKDKQGPSCPDPYRPIRPPFGDSRGYRFTKRAPDPVPHNNMSLLWPVDRQPAPDPVSHNNSPAPKIDRTTQVSTTTNNIGIQTAATKQSKIGTQTDFGMVIVPPAPVVSEEMKQMIAEAALGEDKLDLIPEFIRCKCGHQDVVANMFDCFSCSEYGICAVCSMRRHRLHEVCDSKVNVVHNVVNFCAESNREKLAKWARDIGSLQNKGGQSYDKLCGLLGSTFTNAYENGSTCDVEGLMAACDVSVLKQDVEHLMKANVKMIASVDNLCERLERRKI